VVLGSAKGLNALTMRCAASVDVLGDGCRADEADGLDGGVIEDSVDGLLISVNDVEDAVGKASFFEELREEDGCGGVAFAGLEDEGISAGQCDRKHPEGNHCRKVEGGDACNHSEGLTHGPAVDAGADLVGVLPLEELRNSGGKLNDLEASGHLAFGVGKNLSVLGREDGSEFIGFLFKKLAKTEEDARAAQGWLRGPFREGCSSGFHGAV